jgi:uncharacterized membrane protein
VFSIVATLLILDVRLPAGAQVDAASLRALLPKVAVFLLSFVMVGMYWVAHHNMLHFVRLVDRNLLYLNLLLLLCVVFIPFPTALLGLGLSNPLAVGLYGCALIATNLSGCLLWWYGSRAGLLLESVGRSWSQKVLLLHAAPVPLYGLAILLADRAKLISLLLFLVVPLFFIPPNPLLESLLRNPGADPN